MCRPSNLKLAAQVRGTESAKAGEIAPVGHLEFDKSIANLCIVVSVKLDIAMGDSTSHEVNFCSRCRSSGASLLAVPAMMPYVSWIQRLCSALLRS